MNALIQNLHICTDCDQTSIGSKHCLPIDWQIIDRDNREVILCGDCNSIDNIFLPANDTQRNDNGIMALPMPTSQLIALYHSNIQINLSLDDSEAIIAALTQANIILRGEHPSQMET